MAGKVDPITLSVVRGVLETTQREMTLTLERTARSNVFTLSHDYSNSIFDHKPEMVLQGQDIPIHLGALMPAMKSIASYFEGDIHPGDVMYANEPSLMGSHLADCCVYKPVFFEGELAFWLVSKGHVTDIGGPVPACYNPDAKEIYAEGLRIPPLKIWDKGKPRNDVINMIFTNVRRRRDQEGDLRAQLGACAVGERNLLAMLKKYGRDTVLACTEELLDMADRHMRSLIGSIPDGTYEETVALEDSGHGFGEIRIKATVTIAGDRCRIAIDSPPQIPYFINSYKGNTISGAFLGLMMFAQLDPPYNEGLYRCVEMDCGPLGTLCNAKEPAPCGNSTTTPMESVTDAVRSALEKAAPDRAVASWGHTTGITINGMDTRKGEEYVAMMQGTLISGAGATGYLDGWHACGPECCFGALISGDTEILEYQYPIIIHRYELMTDSGGAGAHRGGSGTLWEVEPMDSPMTFVAWGEARQNTTPGSSGAANRMADPKLGRIEVHRADGTVETSRVNIVGVVKPGERVINRSPGGGGHGDPYRRPAEMVLADVVNGIVSAEAARLEYGVAVDATGRAVDPTATTTLRRAAAE
ncbi:MAG: hydantoinase B/oxoprolinase family protein [Alphaproteobacteria bacterium]